MDETKGERGDGSANFSDELPTICDDMLAPAQPAPTQGRMDFERGMSTAPRLTLLLIAGNVMIFLVTFAKGALESREAIVVAGALARERVLEGELWRLVSAMFLHGSLDHLIGNCIALYILGMACEHAYGLGRAGILYLLSGIGGSLLSTAVMPGPSVGASGAIFGLMGAGTVFFGKYRDRFFVRDQRVGIVLLVWALYSVGTAFFDPFIDNAAHIGGLVGGAGLALALRPAMLDRMPHSQS